MNNIQVKDFDLKHSLECGQFFRYKKLNNYYYVQSRDILFKIQQKNNKLFYEFADKGNLRQDKEFLINFFRLNDNLSQIIKEIAKDKHVKEAVKKYPGLRLIKQDPWECAISYICSSAANIPKIQLNLELLSKHFGKPITFDNQTFYTFPKPGTINNLNKIKESKTGFRSEFIFKANQTLKDIHKLNHLSYEKAKQELIKNKGIGEKIADCICLFSLNKNEAFPVDTWVSKVMKQLYKKQGNPKQLGEFARNYFGKNAGYAQQYLFYMMRQR